MCLLFFSVNENAKEDDFSLVLANNRDEFWARPTKEADFWGSNNACISGLDQEPGREGGTWFGASVSGRIGCLVNISAQQDSTKKGRGFLVCDFLTTPESMEAYAEKIAAEKDDYNGFILTLIDLKGQGNRVVKVTNDRLSKKAVFTYSRPSSDDAFGVGNSPVDHPWQKVCRGKERFLKIVQEHGRVSTKDKLQEQLFQMMADKTRYLPDPQLEKQGRECGWRAESTSAKSAICVWNPDKQYGTRTTTLLFIDSRGNCDYIEKTLQTPVDTENPQWTTKACHFHLKSPCSNRQ